MATREEVAEETVRELALTAGAAPSMHNAQPWQFSYSRGTRVFEVHADPERELPHSDPHGRALHIGCGAAVFNLRSAAAHAGWRPVTSLLPDPQDPQLLATVRLAGPESPGAPSEAAETAGNWRDLRALEPAIRQRHSSRYPFSPAAIPAADQTALREAAQLEGADLSFPIGWHLQLVLDLSLEGEARNLTDSGATADLARWTHTGSGREGGETEGVPEYAYGPRRRGGKAPVRDFSGRRRVAGQEAADFEDSPHLAMLSTRTDLPEDWLRTGQAMQRVLLLAFIRGLSSSFVTQALEWSDLRWPLREPLSSYGHVQMVLRFGYGPGGLATPRRPLEDILTVRP